MIDFFERLDKFMKYKGLNDNKITVATGVSNGIIGKGRKRGSISQENISKILYTYPDLDANWLLTGRGDMIRNIYNVAPTDQNIVKDNNQITMYNNPHLDRKYEIQHIPLYATEVSAGLTTLYSDQTQQTPIGSITIPNAPKCDGAIPVRGDSMYPILKAGDIVCYKEISLENALWGEIHNIYIDADGDEIFVTKYLQKSEKGEEYVTLVSYNPHHQPQDVLKKHIKSIAIVKMSIRYNTNI